MTRGHGLWEVKALLREYDLRPRKGLGQNFLVAKGVLRCIIQAAEIKPEDTILEIGPGLGVLTRALARQARRVIAVELDQHLVEILHQTLADCPNVEIVPGDILKLDPAELITPAPVIQPPASSIQYKVVANIPYHITSALLRHFLAARAKPQLMVVMVQKEVAQRLVAGPGEMSLLAVSVQFYGQPRLVARVPARAFYPPPEVDSAVVRIDVYKELPVKVEDEGRFFEVVRAGFAQRRKQLRNSLSQGLGMPPDEVVEALRGCGVDEKRRAQTLSVEEWGRVYHALIRNQRSPQ